MKLANMKSGQKQGRAITLHIYLNYHKNMSTCIHWGGTRNKHMVHEKCIHICFEDRTLSYCTLNVTISHNSGTVAVNGVTAQNNNGDHCLLIESTDLCFQ